MRPLFIALCLALLPFAAGVTAAPASAAMTQVATLKGRLVGISATSIAVIDETSGKVVHFQLEAPFEEAYSANEKAQIPMNDLRVNSIVRVTYDQSRGGPRRAERIVILKRP
jgi:hypothetical protein